MKFAAAGVPGPGPGPRPQPNSHAQVLAEVHLPQLVPNKKNQKQDRRSTGKYKPTVTPWGRSKYLQIRCR